MLSSLHFKNFKSWEKAELNCAPITGIFGTNSSGKTSLIQFLLLLKQTKDATDRAVSLDLNGDFIQLGTIRDAVHNHDESLIIETNIKFKLAKELKLLDPSFNILRDLNIDHNENDIIAKDNFLKLNAKIKIDKGAPSTFYLDYELGNYLFKLALRDQSTNHFDLEASSKKSDDKFSFTRNQGRAWKLPGPVKSYKFPDQARTYFQNAGFLSDLEANYEKELDKIFYLGPLREPPKRNYLWARSRPTDVGQKGEKAIDAILAATENKEKRKIKSTGRLISFQKIVAHWLREMGLIENFRVEEIAKDSNLWQVKVTTSKGGSEVLLTDVGFGISQVLPVITLLQYVAEGSTVILEQPEIHLHPLAQAALADLIIQAATHRKVQVILESHSEHLLLRLQRRIAEEVVSAKSIKLYFCDKINGNSVLTPLDVDLYGNINNWPENFMGDAFGEIATAEEKRIERRKLQAGK